MFPSRADIDEKGVVGGQQRAAESSGGPGAGSEHGVTAGRGPSMRLKVRETDPSGDAVTVRVWTFCGGPCAGVSTEAEPRALAVQSREEGTRGKRGRNPHPSRGQGSR